MKGSKIKKVAVAAIFTTLIAASAWISIFTPFGINLTLQMFAVCLAGFCLGAKAGVISTVVYLAIGAAGLPVFSAFTGGVGILFGASGGFLWGFIITALLCGIASKLNKKFFKFLLMISSVLLCHVVGVIQYSIVTGNSVFVAALTVSLPFLVKDIIFVFLAEIISKKIKI